MNSKTVALVTLLAIFGCAIADQASTSNIQLSVFSSSNQWWVAVAPQNTASDVTLVELQEGSSSAWTSMQHDPSWDYWQLASSSGNPTGYVLPLSFRLTASNGAQVVLSSVLKTITPGALVSTTVQFGSSSIIAPSVAPEHGSGANPTAAPTAAPSKTTQAPTKAPAHGSTQAPTKAPTHAPTQAPTKAPAHGSTQAPTHAPTAAPTKAPTKSTSAPTKAPAATSPASSGNLCSITSTSSEPLKFLIPLYMDPGTAWTQVATAAKSGVPTIAIINPNSGPDASGPDSSYTTYMAQLAAAGVTMIGYVHTSFGARSISDVTADISTYASLYPGLAGIFIDEAATAASELSYYTQVYSAITSHSGYVNAILNPGTQPDQGYLAVSTNLVVFEDNASNLKSSDFSSWVQCAPNAAEKAGYKYRFSGMAIDATQSEMSSLLSTMQTAGIGMVYVTDATLSGNTYGTLPSFFSQEITAVAALN